MAGLINLALNPTETDVPAAGKVAQAGAKGYDASLGVVNLDTDTVSGQLSKILSTDSPLVTRARAGAMQAANSRGLLNSSMAAGAGEAAAIDAALPIASADASTHSQQRLANQQVSNVADQFGAESVNKTGIINAGEANQAGRLAQQGTIETGLQTLRGTQQMDIATVQSNTQKYLGEIEANYKTLVQTNDSAGKLFQQSMDAINSILVSGDLDATAKQSAIDKEMKLLESGLHVAGKIGDIDIASLLDFS